MAHFASGWSLPPFPAVSRSPLLRLQPPGKQQFVPCTVSMQIGPRIRALKERTIKMRTLQLLCLGLILVLPVALWSQSPVTVAPTQRDPAALATLTQAITAMGALASAAQITTVQASGSIGPATGSGYPGGTFTWTTQVTNTGFEFLNQLVQANGDTSGFTSGHGSPTMSLNGSVQSLFPHMALAFAPVHVPFLILGSALSNSAYTVTAAAPLQIGSVAAIHVHVSNDADGITQALTTQEWYFDPNTGLPLRVESRVPDSLNAMHWQRGTRDFANYQTTSGFLLPLQITNSVNGRQVSVATITSVQFNVAVNASEFDRAKGAN